MKIMKTITLQTARNIAADWHGGQLTMLYAFASSGIFDASQVPLCLEEIEENLNTVTKNRGQAKRLNQLKTYIKKSTK
jgi:hypothetical protein